MTHGIQILRENLFMTFSNLGWCKFNFGNAIIAQYTCAIGEFVVYIWHRLSSVKMAPGKANILHQKPLAMANIAFRLTRQVCYRSLPKGRLKRKGLLLICAILCFSIYSRPHIYSRPQKLPSSINIQMLRHKILKLI